jgi:hypothetical protein
VAAPETAIPDEVQAAFDQTMRLVLDAIDQATRPLLEQVDRLLNYLASAPPKPKPGRKAGSLDIDVGLAFLIAISLEAGLKRPQVLAALGRERWPADYQWLRYRVNVGRELIAGKSVTVHAEKHPRVVAQGATGRVEITIPADQVVEVRRRLRTMSEAERQTHLLDRLRTFASSTT